MQADRDRDVSGDQAECLGCRGKVGCSGGKDGFVDLDEENPRLLEKPGFAGECPGQVDCQILPAPVGWRRDMGAKESVDGPVMMPLTRGARETAYRVSDTVIGPGAGETGPITSFPRIPGISPVNMPTMSPRTCPSEMISIPAAT